VFFEGIFIDRLYLNIISSTVLLAFQLGRKLIGDLFEDAEPATVAWK